MARNTTIVEKTEDTTTQDVDAREPLTTTTEDADEAGDEDAEEADEASQADATASTRTEDGPGVKKATKAKATQTKKPKPAPAAEAIANEPNVSGAGGDGATMTPATGTSREMADKLSTKEGDAPIGVERDSGVADADPTGPKSEAAAMFSHRLPAGTIALAQPAADVHSGVTEVINDFSTGEDRESISGTLNLFDDLGVQRAHIVHLAAKIEEKFGIDITPSEAQNFLLARDVTNLVLRKLARKV